MVAYFLDTSALVKHYRSEPGSERIDILFAEPGSTRMISELAIVEFTSAFRRLRNSREIDDMAMNHTLDRFQADTTKAILVLEFRSDIIKLAQEAVLRDGLRSLDALQLAVVMSVKAESPIFVSADERLIQAAHANGLSTLNPVSFA